MNDKLLLKLSSAQRQLLLDYQNFILDDVIRAISLAIKKGNKYEVFLSEVDFEDLIGYVCSIANHEEDKVLAGKLYRLSDYLDKILEEYE